ncbi:sulfatase [Tundrisphaera sp. TA3]|uniref:sulfatase n=1 Tax=Tundrisphaera sp. TA3 TaxID=3435775 RepID=UPI003EC08596
MMTHDVETSTPAGRRPLRGLPRILVTALWLGMVVGLAELGMLMLLQRWNSAQTIGSLRLNRHYPWMVPMANVLIFGAFGLVLEALARIWPKVGGKVATLVLSFLALVALLLTVRELAPIACVLLACGASVWIGRGIAPYQARLSRMTLVTMPVLVAAIAALYIGRHAQFAARDREAENRPPAKAGSPNVLFLVLDTVRAKSLSLYGYERKTSPRLEQLATKGIRFDNARSTAPWTLPSHSSMFTGLWPHELFTYPDQPLDAKFPTLAQKLSARGYATGGFVANTYYCNAGFGLSNGFDHYEDFYAVQDATWLELFRNAELSRRVIALSGNEESLHPDGRKDADRVSQDFLRWSETRKDRPFFAFLNYFDAHVPYRVPDHTDVCHFGLVPETAEDAHTLASWQKRTETSNNPRDVELARDAYDDCIAYLDGALGRLFDEMGKRGMIDNTLIVVTSDHGEQIGEHGLYGHGRSLYREELHVPLLIVQPGRTPAGKVVAQPVSLRDLPSTVLDMLGVADEAKMPGTSLVATWDPSAPPRPASADVIVSEVAIRDKISKKPNRVPALKGPMYSIIADNRVYIRGATGDEELYDFAGDPTESVNLAGAEASTIERFRGRLEQVAGVVTPRTEAIATQAPKD